MLIKFKVWGNLRFLSHAQTAKLFQRACIRAGIEFQYSQGFNPRPRLSLPLPRTVGVESDDDLLCLRAKRPPNEPRTTNHESRIKAGLSRQLPEGCELLSVTVAKANVSFHPRLATYVLAMKPEYINDKLKATIKRLLASESLNVERRIDPRGNIRNVDVRGFLKSIQLNDRIVVVECGITSAGSIRVEEILKLLKLDTEKLAAPIRRTSVQWKSN